jgi:glycosyltransferase involved in cell wall biosynthesis
MRSQPDILLFSTADWDNPFWTNKQQMAVLFAKRGYRVLYVDSLGLRRPGLHKRDFLRIAGRLRKALPVPRQVQPGLWRLSPLVLPLHSSPLAAAAGNFLLQAVLRPSLRLLGMPRPLIWTYNPLVAELCASLPHSGIIYHCVDDLRAAPHIDGTAVARGEEKLGRAAGLCFVTSLPLRERMQKIFPKVVYEPNVCEQAFFETAVQGLPEPEELRSLPRPRLLFIGALSAYKVDFPLLETLARALPEARFTLIGQKGEGQPDSASPPCLPNVHLLGAQAYGRLPYFMANCEAAILPAPRNAYTDAMFPMKFFEYLAAGLPLAATRLPALADFENLYFPADTADEFCNNLRRILNGERRDPAAIIAACRRHNWEARFARMEKAIHELVIPKQYHRECTL